MFQSVFIWLSFVQKAINIAFTKFLWYNKPSECNGHTSQLHGMAITLRMSTAISPGQWQPWTAVSPLLGLISMELCCVTIEFRWFILTFYVVTLAFLLIQVIHTPYALPRLSCTATATTFTLWSWRLKECLCTRFGSKRRDRWSSVRPLRLAMPCWWVLTRTKQLSMTATARVIWLCACVRYSCVLSDLAFEWNRGWSWPCFDTNPSAFNT